jgi:hypothetical protein
MPYRVPGQPLYFIEPSAAPRPRWTPKTCQQVIARWGRPPFWGRTMTG